MKTFELLFTDGTTQDIEAETVQDAWAVGKFLAYERHTYLLNIKEK